MARLSYMGICSAFALMALSGTDQVYSSQIDLPFADYSLINQQQGSETGDSTLVDKEQIYVRGHRGKKGERGHRGKRGTAGIPGATGAQGPTGPTGDIGPTGPVVMGVAQSYDPGHTGSQTVPMNATGGTSAFVALAQAATGGGMDFTAPYFTVPFDGMYFITYGLSCEGSPDLIEDFSTEDGSAKLWIGVHRTSGQTEADLGAVPLGLANTTANSATGPDPRMLSGFGQMQTHLIVGDEIRLKVYGSTDADGSEAITIGSGQLYDARTPSVLLNNGGTLSVMLIPQ